MRHLPGGLEFSDVFRVCRFLLLEFSPPSRGAAAAAAAGARVIEPVRLRPRPLAVGGAAAAVVRASLSAIVAVVVAGGGGAVLSARRRCGGGRAEGGAVEPRHAAPSDGMDCPRNIHQGVSC